MDDKLNEAAYTKPVIEMITIANEFCKYVEKINGIQVSEMLLYFQKVLPLMYLKGSLLPEIIVDDNSTNERFVTAEQWEELFTDLRKKFALNDEFWYIDHDSPDISEPVKGSLSEHISDIYQDMNDFVILYQKSSRSSKQNAANEIRNLFYSNWGPKVINAMKKIHALTKIEIAEDEDYLDFI